MEKKTPDQAPPAPVPLRGYGHLPKGALLYRTAELAGPGFMLGVVRPGEPIWQEVDRGLVKILGDRAGAAQVEVVPGKDRGRSEETITAYLRALVQG